MNVFQLPQQLSLPQKEVASILWFSHLNSIWNCFSLCSASVFLPLIIYKSVSFRQSSQAYRPIWSTGSFQSMLVNRTYSWRYTPRNCCRKLCSTRLPWRCLVSKLVKTSSSYHPLPDMRKSAAKGVGINCET